MIFPVGSEVRKNSKQGGGRYIVVGHINCERCRAVLELREVLEPTKAQRKAGQYNAQYYWCHSCGLYKPTEGTFINLRKVKIS